jgi:hypothetical protein
MANWTVGANDAPVDGQGDDWFHGTVLLLQVSQRFTVECLGEKNLLESIQSKFLGVKYFRQRCDDLACFRYGPPQPHKNQFGISVTEATVSFAPA